MAGLVANDVNRMWAHPYGVNREGGSLGGLYRQAQINAAMQKDAYTAYQQQDVTGRLGLTALGATVGPDGKQNVTFGRDPMQDFESQLSIRDRYNQAAEQRWLQSIDKYINPGQEQAGISRNSGPIRAAELASQNAAFARAKDRAGLIARGSLESLQDTLAGRGMLGSGMEQRGYADIINKGQTELSDVVRQQAIDEADRAERRADTEYSGAITQRGQNIQQGQSMLSLLRQSRMY